MQKGFYFLSVPYQGSEEDKKYRTELSLKVTMAFLRQGIHLFAPLLYVNKVADELGFSSLEKRREVIMPYLLDFLRVSNGLILLKAEGWQKSWGVQQELTLCHELHIPVFTMEVEDINKDLPLILTHTLSQDQLRCFLGNP